MKNRLLAVVVLSLCIPLASTAQPGLTPPGLAPQHLVDSATAAGRVSVIVELGGAATALESQLPHAAAVAGQRQSISQAQADVRRALRGLVHRVHREYASMPYMALTVGPDALRMLGTLRGLVTRIDEDVELQLMLGESAPLVQAPTAWAAGRDGQGTVIAVIDNGVDKDHFFLNAKVVEEACFVRGPDGLGGVGGCPNGLDSQLGADSGLPCTDCTHGTHVSGIAAGNGAPPANVSFSGVARGASLMAIRVFADEGSASLSDVLFGLERVYAIRATRNFAAVNMSLGIPGVAQPVTCDAAFPAMTTVIQNLRAAGIATVISSGNDGFTNAVSFPACISSAISVGSSDDGSFSTTLNQVSDFSNIAPFVSLLAPGQWITSSYPGNIYQTIAGTSMAAPHVAGAFAILKQAAPGASVTEMLTTLRNTGVPLTDSPSIQRPGALSTVLRRIRVGDALSAFSGIGFGAATFSVAESGTATITVTRTGSATTMATVHYATSNGTASAGSHYVAASGTLTFNPGETSQTFTVAPIDNTVVNGDRTVNLALSSPAGAALTNPTTAVLTITNDDNGGALAFAGPSFTVAENGGPAAIEVVRTGTSLASGVTVRYATIGGTAAAGVAYTATSGTLTFAAGATSLTFNVAILNNTLFEPDKTFQVRLSDAGGGGALGSPTTATVTIQEDDTPGTFQFSSPTYTVTEGTPAATVTVTRTGSNLAGGVRIGYATSNGTATAGSDYTAAVGTLTFGVGVTSMTFAAPITNDVLLEPAETVNLTLSVPAGSPAILGAPATAVLTILDNDAPSVRFSVATQSVAEGSTASIMVTRTGGLNAAVTVDYEVFGGTATGNGVDYTLANGTLSFAAAQTSKTISIPTVNDTLAEGPETVILRLVNPTGGAVLGALTSTTLTITDNDNAGTIQFSAAAYSVAENVPGGAFNLLVTRTGTSLASEITVDYAVTGGTATGGDYTLASGTLTFGAGQTSLPIAVSIHDDGDPEGNETVIVTLTNPFKAALGAVKVTTLTILDDEQALTFSSPTYAVTEGTASIAIPILRAGPTPAGTTVTCRTVLGGSAVVDVDYRVVNTTLTFAAASRMVNCTVPIVNNTVVDPGPRTVNLELSIPGGPGLLGAPSTAALTINDNDQGGVIRFGAATYTVAEGATGALTVMRTGTNLAGSVSVSYAVTGGTALGSGVDYTLANGTLSFAAGQATATISVPTVNDTRAEGPETVIVTLSSPTGGASLGVPLSTTLTITDNDNAGTIQFSAAAYSVAENLVPGGSGTFNLLVTRTGASLASEITVDYAVTGGTATGGDYTLASGTLTFGAGQTSLPIAVSIHDDGAAEGNETVIVTLSNPFKATLGAVKVATLTILDDEQALTFSSPTYAVTEGTASIAIPVLRSGPTPAGTTVTCRTAPGPLVAPGVDYVEVSTTLTFAAGARMVNCTVPILNNTVVDPGPRTVNLELSIPGGPGLLGAPSTAVLTINDNDQGGVIRFGAAAYTVAEGATGALTVMRTGTNLAGGVSVSYAVTGGTALGSGIDYTLANGTLSFAAGQTTATIAVPTVNDTLVEGPESVIVTLSGPTGGASLGVPLSTTLTITDNDNPGTIQFSAAAYSVAENLVPGGTGTFNLLVTRTGTSLASAITVDYAVTGGTATGGGDYTLASGTLTFGAGQTSLPIAVSIHDDALAEGNETVIVTLSNPFKALLGAVKVATLTIVDDEQTLSFSAPAYAVTEGTASIAIPILRVGPTPAGTTVTCQTVPTGSAVPGTDYTDVNTTLTFAAGAKMVNCIVPILNNTVVDGARNVNLELSIPAGSSGLLGTPSVAPLTINDNDLGGTIRFGAATFTINEGAVAAITVTRAGVNLAGGVTVDYALSGGTATNGIDFNLVDGTLTFNAGQTSRTIQVPTFTDILFDKDETFIVTLSNPTSGASVGVPASTTVTIKDTTRPAQVRFLNNLLICTPACRAFTARLTAEEHYVWSSSTGTSSAYQNVTSATLSNFIAEALGFGVTLQFNGSFSITPNEKYLLLLDLNSSNNPALFLFDEGPVGAVASTSSTTAPPPVGSMASGAPPGIRFAPLREALVPAD